MVYSKLETPVQYLKGVGPKLAKVLAKLNIHTIHDLIYFLPRSYEDRRQITTLASLRMNEPSIILVKIEGFALERTRFGTRLLKVLVKDGSGFITAVWFNQPFLLKLFKKDMRLLLSGKKEFIRFAGQYEFVVKNYEIIEEGTPLTEIAKIVPIYNLTEGLYQRKIRQLAQTALAGYLHYIEDVLPTPVVRQYRLPDLKRSVLTLHSPQDLAHIQAARDRLAFDEFFIFQLLLASRRREVRSEVLDKPFSEQNGYLDSFLNTLPFTLTSAQQRVWSEINRDLLSVKPMNRLLQGDVGSGKTIIAALAALFAHKNGYQTAIMAPTEILAAQHFEKLKKYFEPFGIEVRLLVSSQKTNFKKEIKEALEKDHIDILIGTHALIQKGVDFSNLGLAIVDEQHRFGVTQRKLLREKGKTPHMLVMTATPIPRSLSLTLYGDLDRSVIEALPPGRTEVKTSFVAETNRRQVFEFIRSQVQEGRQVFVVCPMIEESLELDLKAVKKEYKFLSEQVFPDLAVGLLHGRMRAEDKDKVMREFRDGKIDILVSTTVIEVGIDIPNASLMLIEHVERFGLSGLHQLRGRIGRGAAKSYCILMGNPKTDEAKVRVRAMVETQDGFKLAEVDLKLRGPGDYFGVRQSGLPAFVVADIIKDEKILRSARQAAFGIVKDDPKLELAEHKPCKDKLLAEYGDGVGGERLD